MDTLRNHFVCITAHAEIVYCLQNGEMFSLENHHPLYDSFHLPVISNYLCFYNTTIKTIYAS